MEKNTSVKVPLKQLTVFELEGFHIPPGYGSLLFVLALLDCMVTLLGNGAVACIIVVDKSLHRPMFVMVCNLMACDLLGATAVLPSLMRHFLTGQRKITYVAAVTQAFCVHVYGAAVQTVLGVMAYDRYVAVCEPLRYPTIMTPARLHTCCALAWIAALLCIVPLFAFHNNVPLCGNILHHVYCSNRAILSLACHPIPINNIYGLSMTWSLSTSVFLIIIFSYFRILHAMVKQSLASGVSNYSKALRTCTSHFVVYVVYEISSVLIILSYRVPFIPSNVRKFLSILFIILPPAMNPIIYGLVSKELRTSITKHISILAGWSHKAREVN